MCEKPLYGSNLGQTDAELYQSKNSCDVQSRSARESGWLTGPSRVVFFLRCHCQLALLSAKFISDLSVSICRGPLEEAVRTSVSVPDGAAVLPGEEWVASRGLCKLLSLGRVWRPWGCICQVWSGHSANDRQHSRACGGGGRGTKRLEVVVLFLGPGLDLWCDD